MLKSRIWMKSYRSASLRLQGFGRGVQIPLGLCAHRYITPPPPKGYSFHMGSQCWTGLLTQRAPYMMPVAHEPGEETVHDAALRVWPCRGRAKTRIPFLPLRNMQTKVKLCSLCKDHGGWGVVTWHQTCCYRISNLWDQVCFLLSLSLGWKVQKSTWTISASPLAAGGQSWGHPFPLPHSLASHILPSASHSLDSQQEPYISC